MEDENGKLWKPERDHPRSSIRNAIDVPDYRYRFFTMITRGLADGQDLTDGDWENAWDTVAFTNFVPSVVDGRARARPGPNDWQAGRDEWGDLLERLRPRTVVVLGYGLWDQMPLNTIEGGKGNVQSYLLNDGSRAICHAVRHPAGGLSWRVLAQAISDVERRARGA